MKKIKNLMYLAGVALMTAPVTVLAVDPGADFSKGWDTGDTAGGSGNLVNTSVVELVNTAMLWLLGILAFIAIIAFVIAGIMYITAAGDESKIEKAKTAMTYSIVGIVVALLGWVVLTAITSFLGGSATF